MSLKDHILDHGADDTSILRYLDQCAGRYADSDKTALFDAIVACARFQAVIPDWAADAILTGEGAIARGDLGGFVDLFGKPPTSKPQRKKEALIRQHQRRALALLTAYRCTGGSWNRDQACGAVAEEIGVGRHIVEAILDRHPSVKSIPQGNPSGTFHERVSMKIAMPRRRGRKIL